MKNTKPTHKMPIVHIVDDDDAVRDALVRLFSSVGLEIKAYASGDEFIESFTRGQVGCLVIDIRMPGMSGLEVQKALNVQGIELPIVIITGH